MKTTPKTKKQTTVKTVDLRGKLKVLLERELDLLPETLETLEPKERLRILVRLMPLVLPRSKAVHYAEGEPTDWSSLI